MHCDLFKIYCASPPITSQLVLFLWHSMEIGPLRQVRVVEALQTFGQKCDPVTLSGIHIHIAGVQQFNCRWDTFCIKDLYPFQWPFRPRCPVSRSITTDSYCLLMFSSLIALPCWGPSVRALECLQSLPDFQHSICFLSIQSPIARLTTLYSRPGTGSGPVNGAYAPFSANSSALSLPKMPSCTGTHTSWNGTYNLAQGNNIFISLHFLTANQDKSSLNSFPCQWHP